MQIFGTIVCLQNMGFTMRSRTFHLFGVIFFLLVSSGYPVLCFLNPSSRTPEKRHPFPSRSVTTTTKPKRTALLPIHVHRWSTRHIPTWSSSSSSLQVLSKFFTKISAEGEENNKGKGSTITTITDSETRNNVSLDESISSGGGGGSSSVVGGVGSYLTEIPPPTSPPTVSKFRQLKDVMWVRECLEDLTAAEFALSVEEQSESSILRDTSNTINGSDQNLSTKRPVPSPQQQLPRKKKRAVDYEKLLSQLTKRIEDMTCDSFVWKGEAQMKVENQKTGDGTRIVTYDIPILEKDRGMGRYAYSGDERVLLLE
jgi:hypothetical protein